MPFKKQISSSGLLFASIGGIVGSGWLFGPFYAAKVAGPAACLSWLIGGLLMMIIALTFAELASSLPKAGGMVRFTQYSHGTLVSFTMSWISWLASVMVAPIETMATIQYAANYLPAIANSTPETVTLTPIGIVVAAVIMFSMCWVNFFSVKFFAKSNAYIVVWKLIIPVVTIGFLFSLSFTPTHFTQYGGFAPYGIRGILAALPTAGVIFSFIGYNSAIQLAAETHNPQKAIPFAIVGSLVACIVLYVVLQIAFIGATDEASLSQGWSKLHYLGDHGPIAGILASFGVGWFVAVLYLDALVSPLGTAYIYTAATARMNFAMSRNGYMPSEMETLNKNGAPVKAIMTNFCIGMIFFLPFPGWQSMVGFLVSCFVLAYAIGPLACVSLRDHLPDLERPFKVPYVRTTSNVAFYICNLLVYWTGWSTVWKMLLTIGLGYVVLAIQRMQRGPKEPLHAEHAVWLFPYLAGLAVISYLGDFGGRQVITFGWDFLVIGIFSLIVFKVATRFEPSAQRPAHMMGIEVKV